MSEKITEEEMVNDFINACKHAALYWSKVNDLTEKERCEGVVFSILNMIDGSSGSFPCAIDLVMRPHPDDKQFNIDSDKKYVEDGMVINDDKYLHNLFYK